MTTARHRRILAWRSGALPVLALLAATTLVLYWPARRCGLISDAWVLLHIANLGLERALVFNLSYHTIPVTHLLDVVLWRTFGLWQPGYQLLNLAELALAAWLLYFLGLRLFRRPRIALLAALFLVANASFYQVTFWPVVGNFQILAGLFQIAGVMAALRAAEAPRPAPWTALFGLLSIAAFFTYEPAVSLLAAGVLAAALVPRERRDLPGRTLVRRSLPVLFAAVLAFVSMLVIKLVFLGSGESALFLPASWDEVRTRLYYIVRACLGLVTLRADEVIGHQISYLGFLAASPPSLGSPGFDLLLAGWLAVIALASLFVAWKTRRPAVVFLLLWFWIHVLTVSVATVIQSRMYFLAALPSSLLLAWAVTRAADAVAGLLARPLRMTAAAVSASLAFLTFGLLATGAKVDLNAAAVLHREITENHREIVRLLHNRIATNAPPESVILVNMPISVMRGGFSAPAFANGIPGMLLLEAGVESEKVLLVAPVSPGTGYVINESMTLVELHRRVHDPRSLVLRYDRTSGRVVEVTRLTWSLPRGYTPAETPYLPWTDGGAWSSFPLAAGWPLEMPLAATEPGAWVAVRFLRLPSTDLSVAQDGVIRHEIRPEESAPHWPAFTFPLEAGPLPTILRLTSASGTHVMGLWTFRPPASYGPETAPFLTWYLASGEPNLVVDRLLRLPLARSEPRAGPLVVRVEYMAAPERGLSLEVEGGERREAVSPAGEPQGWRTIELAAPAAPVTVLLVEPRGAPPLLVRSVALERAGSSLPAPGVDILQNLEPGDSP